MSSTNKATTPFVTPLLYSPTLSQCINHPVYLKLENVQPTNSFKIRGMAHICQKRIEANPTLRGFVTFSGGNAGQALAYVSKEMGLPCYIFLPSFVSERVLNRMRAYGAVANVAGSNVEARQAANKMAEDDKTVTLIHPYDDEELWEGYSTAITEIKSQLMGVKPSCIVVSVSGGGLLMGITRGLENNGWETTPILAMETEGAHSFNKSLKAGKSVENVMTSIARTLGAPFLADEVLKMAGSKKFKIVSNVQTDKKAVEACLRFADDHAFCVEPACGVSLSPVYQGILPEILAEANLKLGDGPVVIIVCGGTDCSVKILQDYANIVGADVNL